MFTIWKRFDFSASHRLNGLPDDHPCSRLHGHNYSVELEFTAVLLDSVGFVIDYRSLDAFKRWIDSTLDHRDLNQTVQSDVTAPYRPKDADRWNPTAENLAWLLYVKAREIFASNIESRAYQIVISAVRVRETEKTCAEFRP